MNVVYVYVTNWTDYTGSQTFTGCLVDKDGDEAWFKNGKMHREDGPAYDMVSCPSACRYYLNDKQYDEQDYRIALRKIKLEKVLKKIEG